MLRPKKNSYKEFDNENKFLRLENSPPPPPPPHNFSNGLSLSSAAGQGCFELLPCSCCFSPVLYYHSIRLGFLKVQCLCRPDVQCLCRPELCLIRLCGKAYCSALDEWSAVSRGKVQHHSYISPIKICN